MIVMMMTIILTFLLGRYPIEVSATLKLKGMVNTSSLEALLHKSASENVSGGKLKDFQMENV